MRQSYTQHSLNKHLEALLSRRAASRKKMPRQMRGS